MPFKGGGPIWLTSVSTITETSIGQAVPSQPLHGRPDPYDVGDIGTKAPATCRPSCARMLNVAMAFTCGYTALPCSNSSTVHVEFRCAGDEACEVGATQVRLVRQRHTAVAPNQSTCGANAASKAPRWWQQYRYKCPSATLSRTVLDTSSPTPWDSRLRTRSGGGGCIDAPAPKTSTSAHDSREVGVSETSRSVRSAKDVQLATSSCEHCTH